MLYWMLSVKVYTHPKALYGWRQASPIWHSLIIPKWTIEKGLACIGLAPFLRAPHGSIREEGKEESLLCIDL